MSSRRFRHPTLALMSALSIASLSACDTDKVTAAPTPVEGSLLVDASLGWTFTSLHDKTR